MQRYEFVRECRENLRLIARSGPAFVIALKSTLYIVRDRHTGERTMQSDAFRAALDEEGVEIDYIRQCAVCGVIYYEDRLMYKGKRVDPACRRHGQTLRSRRNYRPVKTADVQDYLAESPGFKRSPESIKELAGNIGATERQVTLAIDFLKRKEAG